MSDVELRYKDGTLMVPKIALTKSHQRYLLYDNALRRPAPNKLPRRRLRGEEKMPYIDLTDPNSEFFVTQKDTSAPQSIKSPEPPKRKKHRKKKPHQVDPKLLTKKLNNIVERQESFRKMYGAPIFASNPIIHPGQPKEYSNWGPCPVNVPGLKSPDSLKFIMPIPGVELPEVVEQLKLLKMQAVKKPKPPPPARKPTRVYKFGSKEFVSLSNSKTEEFYRALGKPRPEPKIRNKDGVAGGEKYSSVMSRKAKARVMKFIYEKRAENDQLEKLNDEKNKVLTKDAQLANQLEALKLIPSLDLRLPALYPGPVGGGLLNSRREVPISTKPTAARPHVPTQSQAPPRPSAPPPLKFPPIGSILTRATAVYNNQPLNFPKKPEPIRLPTLQLNDYHQQRMTDVEQLDKARAAITEVAPARSTSRKSLLVFNVRLNGKPPTPAVLDTEVTVSTVTKRLADELSLTKYMVPLDSDMRAKYSLSPIVDFVKHSKILGSLHSIRVRVGLASPVLMNFQVVQSAESDCILGFDFMRSSKALINLEEETIIFEHGKYHVPFMSNTQLGVFARQNHVMNDSRYFGPTTKPQQQGQQRKSKNK